MEEMQKEARNYISSLIKDWQERTLICVVRKLIMRKKLKDYSEKFSSYLNGLKAP